MASLKGRIEKLENASSGGDYQACLRYARKWAELMAYDETPWTEEKIQEHARQIQQEGGPWTFEELLTELEREEQERSTNR